MDPKLEKMLLKLRKRATAGFTAANWELVLDALNFGVERSKDNFKVYNGLDVVYNKDREEGYKRVALYDLERTLKAAGSDLVVLASVALDLESPDEEAKTKACQRIIDAKGRPGTCQACFGQYLVKVDTDLISNHGFNRPGCGYLIGICLGSKKLPFELDCEITKNLKSILESNLRREQGSIAELEADKVETLGLYVETEERDRSDGGYIKKWRVVKRGDAAVYAHNRGSIPSFEDLKSQVLDRAKSSARQLSRHIEQLRVAIEGWVLKPFAVSISKA